MPTHHKRRFSPFQIAAAVLALLVGALAVLAATGGGYEADAATDEAPAASYGAQGKRPQTIEVDVAENHTRFHFAEAPVFDDGFPSEGNPFFTAGYLYPAGTLSAEQDGVDEDGSPTYPDKVIGEWLCRGYLIGEGAHATEGSWVYSTQVFSFGDDPTTGQDTIVVVGYEGAGIGEAVAGAITGGTGRYRAAVGEAEQRLLGFTLFEGNDADMPIKKHVELEVRGPRGQ